jgi:hypothetical protein
MIHASFGKHWNRTLLKRTRPLYSSSWPHVYLSRKFGFPTVIFDFWILRLFRVLSICYIVQSGVKHHNPNPTRNSLWRYHFWYKYIHYVLWNVTSQQVQLTSIFVVKALLWSSWYSWNIAESGIKHQKSNQIWSRFKLTTSVVIGTDCIGSCKCNYHAITPRQFSPGTPVSSINKTDYRDITEILLKVTLSTIKPQNQ